MFDGFETFDVQAGDVRIHLRRAGSGPPLLLLHGYPQTHVIWHRIAPQLSQRFNVVATDLRGYGDSAKPVTQPDHAPYSKRSMAADQAEVMKRLGFDRFHVVGHDRGGRVGHRLAADHGARVLSLTVLDIAPTLAMYEQTTNDYARAYWHWFFLIRPAPLPERMIGADPRLFLREKMRETFDKGVFAPAAWKEYERCFTPGAIHASCEDYRAAASIDLDHDRADRESGRKLACKVLALWGAFGVVERCFKPLDEWRRVADDVRGRALQCGHYLPEEAPDEVRKELESFIA